LGASLVVVGDVNGDGAEDVAIGSPGAYLYSAVRLVSGADGKILWTRRDQVRTHGPEEIGLDLDLLSDRDKDGVPELLVGGGCHNPHGSWDPTGNVHILSGKTGEVLVRMDEWDFPELRRPLEGQGR